MAYEKSIQWGPNEEARAWVVLQQMASAESSGKRPIVFEKDLALVMTRLVLSASRLTKSVILASSPGLGAGWADNPLGELTKILSQDDSPPDGLGSAQELAYADKMGTGVPYRAALAAVRLLWRRNRLVPSDAAGRVGVAELPSGGAKNIVPVVPLVLGLAGIAAAAITTYYVSDRVCQVYDGTAVLALTLQNRLDELQLRIAKGAPLPPPPAQLQVDDFMRKLAAQQSSTSLWLAGAGAVVAGLGAYGVYGAMKKKTTRSAPSSSSASSPTRPNPSRKKKKKRKGKKGRRPNPLKHGYSKATVSRNIASMIAAKRAPAVAAAASLGQAREDYRKRHPRGAFPRHLETPAERAANARRSRSHGKKRKKLKAKATPKRKSKPKARPKAKPKRRAKR